MTMNSDQIKTQLFDEGYAVLPGVLSKTECERLKTLFRGISDRFTPKYFKAPTTTAHKLDDKSQERIVYNIHNKDESILQYLDHAAILPYVEAVLQRGSFMGKEPITYQNSAARTPLPGAPAQQLHIDARIAGSPVSLGIQVMWVLDSFTEKNGATRIVPGSHKLTNYPENGKAYPNEKTILAEQGSVFMFDAGVWHGAGANTSDQERWAMILTYGRWFLKNSFDFNQNMPRNLYEKLNDRQKELLGYKFNPPKDEFTRISRRSLDFEPPAPYFLP